METFNLSYILTTFNKLPYLKLVLPFLLENCKSDEEIVVVDGGSSDGSVEYLKDLYLQNKIHQYISEKDFGESHGTNKAILMARGKLIKIITDDDLFHYPTIEVAKNHMLSDHSIDVIGFDGFGYHVDSAIANKRNVWKLYMQWKSNKNPFVFCGLSIIFRKNKLAYLGLLNTTQIAVDFEYTLRITSLKNINMRWIKNWGFINIANASSNSIKFEQAVYLDGISNKLYYQHRKNLKYFVKRNIIFALSIFIKKEDKKEIISIENIGRNLPECYIGLNQFLYSTKNHNELL